MVLLMRSGIVMTVDKTWKIAGMQQYSWYSQIRSIQCQCPNTFLSIDQQCSLLGRYKHDLYHHIPMIQKYG